MELRQNSGMDRPAVIQTYGSVWITWVLVWIGGMDRPVGSGYGSGLYILTRSHMHPYIHPSISPSIHPYIRVHTYMHHTCIHTCIQHNLSIHNLLVLTLPHTTCSTPILHHLFSISCFPHAIFTFLLLLVGRS